MKKSYTLKELSALLGAELVGDPNVCITGVDTLETAGPEDGSFLANPRYAEAMKTSSAGVICIAPHPSLPPKNYLLSTDPSRTFQKLAELFTPNSKTGFQGIHPTAVIHPNATLHPTVTVGPYAVIDQNTTIGAHTYIGPHVSIGFHVSIGESCYLHPHSVVREHCQLKNRVILQPGAIIGSCGFGYIPNAKGEHIKLEQVGIVILEEDVEIGANTTIDRARFKATLIRRGTKIDNLVQIAHNVEVGEHNVIAAQTGIAGSTKTGANVMMGGQVGVLGHVEIEANTLLATRSGVSKSLKSGKYRGAPAIPIAEYNRQEVYIRKLEEYVTRLKNLEKKLAD